MFFFTIGLYTSTSVVHSSDPLPMPRPRSLIFRKCFDNVKVKQETEKFSPAGPNSVQTRKVQSGPAPSGPVLAPRTPQIAQPRTGLVPSRTGLVQSGPGRFWIWFDNPGGAGGLEPGLAGCCSWPDGSNDIEERNAFSYQRFCQECIFSYQQTERFFVRGAFLIFTERRNESDRFIYS